MGGIVILKRSSSPVTLLHFLLVEESTVKSVAGSRPTNGERLLHSSHITPTNGERLLHSSHITPTNGERLLHSSHITPTNGERDFCIQVI